MEGYFKNRSIFPYEVSRQLHKIENQQQRKIQEEKKNQIRNKIEEQQKQDKLFKRQKETNTSTNEIKISENFGQRQENEQYNYKQGITDLQTSKEPIVANEILGMPLSVQDKADIYNYMQQHIFNKRDIRAAQITEELVNVYFKEANIFISVIEEYVDQLLIEHKSRLKSDNHKNNGVFGMFDASSQLNIKLKSNYEDVKNHLSQKGNVLKFKVILRDALENIQGETFNITSAQLFSKVNLLPKSQLEALWKLVSGKYKQHSWLQLQDYFQNQYNHTNVFRRNKFSVEDQNVIFNYVQNTTSTLATSIAKELKGHFSDRNIPEYLLTNKIRNEIFDKNTKKSENVK
ncbi:Hypothetical_protein [Hexamita inflata]|uniref:Hypothetical_protein n=1 Tax=Hexamita inflata TaxID=28002 RepID=A0AA86Q599_9EUKA|nr:Hypothetical protein HINF_LOCUS40294 [Hexamita inflata]